ncbi:hypothetical protein BM221_009091 [Beauveria bassiana]|uniref:Uncharacterized protein n=1 Tax=Beauveria bassiana TaxID=176275 RepID=A0A2N6NCA4_BEABA|nr:hypothetical protein BM221_009091 [Beauveria bassiana]
MSLGTVRHFFGRSLCITASGKIRSSTASGKATIELVATRVQSSLGVGSRVFRDAALGFPKRPLIGGKANNRQV